MKNNFFITLFIIITFVFCAKKNDVLISSDEKEGIKLVVKNKDFIINGINWDYFPIGKNFEYNLWDQSEGFIKKVLNYEVSLLQNINVNTIRVYTGIPPKWISYIYKNYGIYTMLNHSFGRYGNTVNGKWVSKTDYKNIETQKNLLLEVTKMAEVYKDTPGLLLYLIGNENNYGLFWKGSETEDFPDDKNTKRIVGEKRARVMYKLFNEAATRMKAIDKKHPIAICNGDLLYSNIFAEECKDIDIFGTNIYRGKSFGDAFKRVKNQLKKPILITEFGADAFNAITNSEDQEMQSYFVLKNWEEIYSNVAGLGKANNCIGGFTFQFSDGWWKHGQTKNLNIHDKDASWSNGGYYIDYKENTNNMNEEWFGICAKGISDKTGFYKLYPRAAYYVIQKIHKFDPFKKNTSLKTVSDYFNTIKIKDALNKAKNTHD